MTLFNIIILALTVLQIALTGFSLWIFIAIIGRCIFLCRSIGIIIKTKTVVILEGVGVGSLLLWQSLFKKDHINWKAVIVYLVIGFIVCGLEYLDDLLFVYTTEDLKEEVTHNVKMPKRNKSRKAPKHRRITGKSNRRKRRRA